MIIIRHSANKKRKDCMNQWNINNKNNLFDNSIDFEKNLILPMNNNFRQNPEYFFFKTKREDFRNTNLLSKLDILGIELIEHEIVQEINILRNAKSKVCEKSLTKYNFETSGGNEALHELNVDLSKENTSNDKNLTITDKIKMIIQGNVREYMPKTFKIVVKENKND